MGWWCVSCLQQDTCRTCRSWLENGAIGIIPKERDICVHTWLMYTQITDCLPITWGKKTRYRYRYRDTCNTIFVKFHYPHCQVERIWGNHWDYCFYREILKLFGILPLTVKLSYTLHIAFIHAVCLLSPVQPLWLNTCHSAKPHFFTVRPTSRLDVCNTYSNTHLHIFHSFHGPHQYYPVQYLPGQPPTWSKETIVMYLRLPCPHYLGHPYFPVLFFFYYWHLTWISRATHFRNQLLPWYLQLLRRAFSSFER